MATRTTDHMAAPVRAQVADSWVRSAAAGVLAETVEAPVTLGDHDLRDYREAHPLAAVSPREDDVLGQSARAGTRRTRRSAGTSSPASGVRTTR
jgi:hypothetical protein